MYEFAVTPAVTQIRRRSVKITTVTFAFHGDEIYLRAGLDPPSRRHHHGDYPRIEGGVGVVRSFRDESARLNHGSRRAGRLLSDSKATSSSCRRLQV